MRYVTKEFLSPSAGESGNIVCEITTQRLKDIRDYHIRDGGYISGNIRIADCGNHIILDFDASGQRAFEKRVAKLDKLISEIQAMRHQYVAMWENHQRDLAHYAKQQKEETKKK